MRPRLSEPKVVLLAFGLVLIGVLCVAALADTGDVWIAVLGVLAMGLIAIAIIVDLRGVIGDDDEAPAVVAAPGRAIVMCTAALTCEQVLDAVGADSAEGRSIMFVAPEGLGTSGLRVDEHDYARALRAETRTVAALRRAGINAAGHVGDRNPEHAIIDALALFPAGDVLIVARGDESALYRQHLDVESLKRRTGADVRVLEVVGT
ncbi:hypothetical protein [Solirubrobacter soli]|uniref:hypothetical protein n=1 Tax=Solirubrobacter soli TaxID=363832 RepID=UPI000423D64B|nr:hypothetical protein [Solirubrobacter soli]